MDEPQRILYRCYERMTLTIPNRTYSCIEYPGIVNNVNKAIETLGGLQSVAHVLADTKKRLELRFRPNDVYCKPASSTNDKMCGLLLKVRRRKRQSPKVDLLDSRPVPASMTGTDEPHGCQGQPGDDGYEYDVEVLGKLTTLISFPGMCDYQYLPFVRNKEGENEGILHKLQLTLKTEREEYLSRDAPLFLPPHMFSRFEFPLYGFQNERSLFDSEKNAVSSVLLGTGRKARPAYVHTVGFSDPTPAEPIPEALEVADRYCHHGLREELKALFEERPIWSAAAIRYRLRHNPFAKIHSHLYRGLACFTYSFTGGPWRSFYIRIGYDPRKDPAAKKYQCIDFRNRQLCSLENEIKCRRSNLKTNLQRKRRLDLAHVGVSKGNEENSEPKLIDFEFHPDILPPQRQIFYHACDIYDQEVHSILTKNDGKEPEVCDERNGWGVPNFTDLCRAVMTKHVQRFFPAAAAVPKYDKKKHKKIDQIIAHGNKETDEDVARDPRDSMNESR